MEALKVIIFRLLVYYKNTEIQIYRFIMLPVLCGCDTWLLIFWEEYRARVFENGMLRNILGTKSNEAAGKWRRLHNEQHNKLYIKNSIIKSTPHHVYSRDPMKMNEMAGECNTYGGQKRCIQGFGGET
jgi:hypothetical protein